MRTADTCSELYNPEGWATCRRDYELLGTDHNTIIQRIIQKSTSKTLSCISCSLTHFTQIYCNLNIHRNILCKAVEQ